MVPDYTNTEVIDIKASGIYTFEPNIIAVNNTKTGSDQTETDPDGPDDLEQTDYFGGHYYLIIGSTGTFTLSETFRDKDAVSEEVETGDVDFGIEGIYTEYMLPINGHSEITINGSGISKLIKVSTRQ